MVQQIRTSMGRILWGSGEVLEGSLGGFRVAEGGHTGGEILDTASLSACGHLKGASGSTKRILENEGLLQKLVS